MAAYRTIPIETLHQLLICDPVAGTLTWRERTPDMFTATPRRTAEHMANNWNARNAGKPAFATIDDVGYYGGKIFNVGYRAHRIIWAMTTGKWPEGEIDHEKGKRTDNRFERLSDVTNAQNKKNLRLSKKNKSGVTGVCWVLTRGKWAAQIQVNGKMIALGRFDFFEMAVAVRKAAEIEYGFHPNHGLAA